MQRDCPLCVISERILRIGGKNAGKLCDKSPYRFGNEAFKPIAVRFIDGERRVDSRQRFKPIVSHFLDGERRA